MTSTPPVNPYRVIAIDRDGKRGNQIVLDTNRPDCPEEFIFGMDESPTNLAWLEYIALRLNRAFVNGWYGSQGVSSWPDDDYYAAVDAAWEKLTGKPLERTKPISS